MKTLSRRPKVRELRRHLERLGCTLARRPSSSHEVWRTPRGTTFAIKANHPESDVDPGAICMVRRMLRAEGLAT